jgi:hypothetical protein
VDNTRNGLRHPTLADVLTRIVIWHKSLSIPAIERPEMGAAWQVPKTNPGATQHSKIVLNRRS